jgi:hypothetical protein
LALFRTPGIGFVPYARGIGFVPYAGGLALFRAPGIGFVPCAFRRCGPLPLVAQALMNEYDSVVKDRESVMDTQLTGIITYEH